MKRSCKRGQEGGLGAHRALSKLAETTRLMEGGPQGRMGPRERRQVLLARGQSAWTPASVHGHAGEGQRDTDAAGRRVGRWHLPGTAGFLGETGSEVRGQSDGGGEGRCDLVPQGSEGVRGPGRRRGLPGSMSGLWLTGSITHHLSTKGL